MLEIQENLDRVTGGATHIKYLYNGAIDTVLLTQKEFDVLVGAKILKGEGKRKVLLLTECDRAMGFLEGRGFEVERVGDTRQDSMEYPDGRPIHADLFVDGKKV